MNVIFKIGTGLVEPCSPYRVCPVYGRPLNTPNADGWNCMPNIQGGAYTFDVSGLRGQYGSVEAVVALLGILDGNEGETFFQLRFVKVKTGQTFYTFNWSWYMSKGGWAYMYAYVGLVDWEINEDGDYRVEATIGGTNSGVGGLNFKITGLGGEEEEGPEEPSWSEPSAALMWILGIIFDIETFFFRAYVQSRDWVSPFNGLAPIFKGIQDFLHELLFAVQDFGLMIENVIDRAREFFTWENLEAWFTEYKSMILGSWSFIAGAGAWLWDQIDDWWSTEEVHVKDSIDLALAPFRPLKLGWDLFWDYAWPAAQLVWDRLDVEWSTFKGLTLPGLVNKIFLEAWWTGQRSGIQDLFDSWIKILFPWYDEFAAIVGEVIEFFTGPLDWLKEHVEDWFWGEG